MSWIKLHTKFLEWEWADKANMVSLFVHLLLMANYKDKEWHGITIHRGQLVTSYDKLSQLTGISFQSIRTLLNKLNATGEILVKSTNKYTIITICKYESYQDSENETNNQLTNNQQTSNNQLTTTTEYIERKNNNIVDDIACARTRLEADTINNPLWLEQAAMNLRTDQVLQLATEVMDEWVLTKTPPQEYTAYHLLNHMRRKLERSRKNGSSKTEWEQGLRAGAVQTIKKIYNQ